MKNILVVQGGGRAKGNTAQLVDSFIKGATEAGHTVEKINLNQTEVKGCIGCNACRYGKPCVQKDGFNDLVPKIKAADLTCVCIAAFVLDIVIQNQSIYRTILLYRRGRPCSSVG